MLSKITWPIVALVLGIMLLIVGPVFVTLIWLVATNRVSAPVLAAPLLALLGAAATGATAWAALATGKKMGHAAGLNMLPPWYPFADPSKIAASIAPPPDATMPSVTPPPVVHVEIGDEDAHEPQ